MHSSSLRIIKIYHCLSLNTINLIKSYQRDIEGSRDISSVTWWRHQMETFPPYWPFVRWIRRSPVNCAHMGQWRGALMFSLMCAWTNGSANHRDAGDLRRHCPLYHVTVMSIYFFNICCVTRHTILHATSGTFKISLDFPKGNYLHAFVKRRPVLLSLGEMFDFYG